MDEEEGLTVGTSEHGDDTQREPTGGRATRRWQVLTGLAFVALGALYLISAWDVPWRSEWDSAIYLLTARSLAAGEGYLYAGEPFFLRPPGVSWLLAPFVGTGPGLELRGVHLLLAFFAVASIVAFYAALRSRGRRFALIVALLGATTPAMLERLHWVQSEFPFLAFFFAGVAFVERSFRAERGATGSHAWWLHGLAGAGCLAASYYMRSVAILVLPALVLIPAIFYPGRRWRGVAVAAVFGALALPWMIHAGQVAAEAERPPDQLLLFDYKTALLRMDPGKPNSLPVPFSVWKSRVTENAPAVSSDLTQSVLHFDRPWLRWVVFGAGLAGWIVALRRGPPTILEWFAPAYTALLLLYFDNHPRLSAPLTLFVYLYAAQAAHAAVVRIAGAGRGKRLATGLALAALGANLWYLPAGMDVASQPATNLEGEVVEDVSRGEPWEHVLQIAHWLRNNTSEDAVVLCQRAPMLALLSGRRCYTYRFGRGRDLYRKYRPDLVLIDGPTPTWLTDEAARHAKLTEILVVGGRWELPIYWIKRKNAVTSGSD